MRFRRFVFLVAIVMTLNMSATLACTDILVGKNASNDGSVITSHTGAADDSRLLVIPAADHVPGTMAPVHYGIQDVRLPLGDFGDTLGWIPQVAHTYAYIHSGYPHINEHQLAMGESTMAQRRELQVNRDSGKQIMTIEQAMVFALQRCRLAKDAVQLIGQLVEEYGFLPSCSDESEALCIADPENAWVLEVFSVGTDWDPESGKPGAIWAAQRVPDDHVTVVPNWSIIKEIDIADTTNFLASPNYRQAAIERGWYDPAGSKPFVWQEAYAPLPYEWALTRLWLFYATVAPNYKEWPDKWLRPGPKNRAYDPYHQTLEPLSYYPFSVKPEKPLSVQDVMAFQRSVFEGTIYDMTADEDWLVPDSLGNMVKSPLTTPFPTTAMRRLLDIDHHRNVSKGGYGMVAQLRNGMPDMIGGVYWFFLDNQHVSSYVPIYCGVTDISPLYKNYNPDRYSDASARWAIDFVDNLLYLNWQEGIKDLRAVRDSLEAEFFREQKDIDLQAMALYSRSPERARKLLTDYSIERMQATVAMYRRLRELLITKYTNNHCRP